MQTIKAVVFDFGGVVVNESFQDWISQHIAPYHTIKDELMPMQDKVDKGDASVALYKDYLSMRTGKNPDAIEKEILEAYEIRPEIKSLLDTLRKKQIKTAIISNFPDEWFSKIRKRLQFDHLFDEIFVSSTYGLIKPDAKFFHALLHALEVQPEETVFTDDKKQYTEAAEKLGIHSFVFTSPEQLQENLRSLGIAI